MITKPVMSYMDRLTEVTHRVSFIQDEMVRQGMNIAAMSNRSGIDKVTVRRLLEGTTVKPMYTTLSPMMKALGYVLVPLEEVCLHL